MKPYDVFPKIGVMFYPKMDGENNGKPKHQMDDLGGKSTTILGTPHMKPMELSILNVWLKASTFNFHYCNGLGEGTQVFVSETIFGDLDFLNTGSFFCVWEDSFTFELIVFLRGWRKLFVRVSWFISYTNSCLKNRQEL